MSTSIIKFKRPILKTNGKDVDMIYCKDKSYPCGLGFELLEYFEEGKDTGLFSDKGRFEIVDSIPEDIQYEYIVDENHHVRCQECWFAKDVSYHGGGFRHGGIYDLKRLREREENIKKYTIRRPEDWR